RRDGGDVHGDGLRRRAHARGGREHDRRRCDAVGLQRRIAARGVSRRTALAAGRAVLFLTFLDNTIASVALAAVQTSLRTGGPELQWIVNGYMLAFTALMLTGGTLGDLFGRKKVMLAGVALFSGGSLVGALASGSRTLIVGRVVMGVGAALCEPGTLSIIR